MMNVSPSSDLDFTNTQIAFSALSDSALKRARLLFKAMDIAPLVKYGPKLCHASLRVGLPVTGVLKATIFKQFCGGETLEECQPLIESMAKDGIQTILDYAVEGGSTEAAKVSAVEEVLRTIAFAGKSSHISFAVFKASGLSSFALLEKKSYGGKLSPKEEDEYHDFIHRVLSICQAAYDARIRVFIDAEESWIQPAIDDIALSMMQKFNRDRPVVYTTLQMYRHDRLAYLHTLCKRAQAEGIFLGVKLVRGAYMEKENQRARERGEKSPIHGSKAETDVAFNEAMKYCISNIDRINVCAGTHNEASCKFMTELMHEHQIVASDPRVEFAQLQGMGNHLSYNLAAAHFKVSKYVPFGPIREVLPYLFRRAEENLSIQGQSSRELNLILLELKRRGI